jgi:hypothetical protein
MSWRPAGPGPFPLTDTQALLARADQLRLNNRPEEALAAVAQAIADEVKRFQQAHPDWEGE